METKELIGLEQLDELHNLVQNDGSIEQKCLPLNSIKVVITSKNYLIEIEVY